LRIWDSGQAQSSWIEGLAFDYLSIVATRNPRLLGFILDAYPEVDMPMARSEQGAHLLVREKAIQTHPLRSEDRR
jgi:hypothetical protein